MKDQKHILIIRLSSLGDVALTVTVIKNVRHQNPDMKISILSKSFHQALFDDIEGVEFISFDSAKHKGFFGLFNFTRKELFTRKFTHIVDLHDVLRSKLIRFFYSFKSVQISIFDKGRNEKLDAIIDKSIQETPLKHITERYAAAFTALDFSCDLSDRNKLQSISKKEIYTIGIAPLSKHFTKNYPLEKLQELIKMLLSTNQFQIKILCANKEQDQLMGCIIDSRVSFLMKENNFKKELELIKKLDLVISMDSANMHIATIYNVPVISIWGGTHPNIGFSSYNSNNINVQTKLACRPCSIYGKAECPLGHLNCMYEIKQDEILFQVNQLLQLPIT